MASHRAERRPPGRLARALLGFAALGAVAAVTFAPELLGLLRPDLDCADLTSREQAQTQLVADPLALDPDGDGLACETRFGDAVTVPALPTAAADEELAVLLREPATDAYERGLLVEYGPLLDANADADLDTVVEDPPK